MLIKKIIEKMTAELGYHEKMSNKDLDSKTANSGNGNYTKYARDLWKYSKTEIVNGNKQGESWCAVFILEIFREVLGDNALVRKVLYLPKSSSAAGVPYFYNYLKKKNAIVSTPQAGDLIFFRGHSHIGYVIGVSSSKVTTIEGNASNEVRQKVYARNDKDIDCYGRPNYSAVEPTPEPTPTPSKKTVKASQKPKSHSKIYEKTYTVSTKTDPLAMRNGPSTNYTKMTSVAKGKKVVCGGDYTDNWLYVKYETTDTIYIGFMSKTYLK